MYHFTAFNAKRNNFTYKLPTKYTVKTIQYSVSWAFIIIIIIILLLLLLLLLLFYLQEQLTLIDLALLKSIRRDEFQNCNWTKKEKQTLSPNIVAVSRRFNHVSQQHKRELHQLILPLISLGTLYYIPLFLINAHPLLFLMPLGRLILYLMPLHPILSFLLYCTCTCVCPSVYMHMY